MKVELLATKHLQHFPSASSIEFYNNNIYIIGDDATYLLILDKDYNGIDSLQLFTNAEKRIHKNFKEDLEASAIVTDNGRDCLMVFGSGATEAREKLYLFPLDSLPDYKSYSLASFYKSLKNAGIAEVNIEGAAVVNNKIVISNRANLTTKSNQFIIASLNFLRDSTAPIHIVNLSLPSRYNAGISGLSYVSSSDLLLFTASEEETFSAAADGAIGNSYVGMIEKFSTKLSSDTTEAKEIFALKKVADELKLKKIESITVESVKGNEYIIHLAADNDNGESTLFKLKVNTS